MKNLAEDLLKNSEDIRKKQQSRHIIVVASQNQGMSVTAYLDSSPSPEVTAPSAQEAVGRLLRSLPADEHFFFGKGLSDQELGERILSASAAGSSPFEIKFLNLAGMV